VRKHIPGQVIVFTRRMIEEKNFAPFVDQYNLSRPEAWQFLPGLLGRMIFLFEGLDESTPPLQIAALRQFLSAFHLAWPHWTIFSDLSQEDLRVMTFCCLESVRIVRVPGQQNWALFYDPEELDAFLAEDFMKSSEQLRWTRYSKRWIKRRIAAVKEYFRGPLNLGVFQPGERRVDLLRQPGGCVPQSGFSRRVQRAWVLLGSF